jgi:hypothetical protein
LLCLDYTYDSSAEAAQPSEVKPPTLGVNIDTVNNSCNLIGSNFSGRWETRRTFVITAGKFYCAFKGTIFFLMAIFVAENTSGLVGYFQTSDIGTRCSQWPWCAVKAVNAPAPGIFYVTVRKEAIINNWPPQSSPVTPVSPPLVGR